MKELSSRVIIEASGSERRSGRTNQPCKSTLDLSPLSLKIILHLGDRYLVGNDNHHLVIAVKISRG